MFGGRCECVGRAAYFADDLGQARHHAGDACKQAVLVAIAQLDLDREIAFGNAAYDLSRVVRFSTDLAHDHACYQKAKCHGDNEAGDDDEGDDGLDEAVDSQEDQGNEGGEPTNV